MSLKQDTMSPQCLVPVGDSGVRNEHAVSVGPEIWRETRGPLGAWWGVGGGARETRREDYNNPQHRISASRTNFQLQKQDNYG
jgi:hypothetical protein